MAKIIDGKSDAQGLRIGIVVSRFNHFITSKLLDGALVTFRHEGIVMHSRIRIDRCHTTALRHERASQFRVLRKNLMSTADVQPRATRENVFRDDGFVNVRGQEVPRLPTASW